MWRPRRNQSHSVQGQGCPRGFRGQQDARPAGDRFDLTPPRSRRRTQLIARTAEVFAAAEGDPRGTSPPVDLKALHAKIGQQALKLDFLAGARGRLPDPSARG